MKLNIITSASLLLGFLVFDADAQQRNEEIWKHSGYSEYSTRRYISIPDIPGYKTLKADFHIHSVFSDGRVTAATRVDEAWCDGLDVIAMTDHIEVHKYPGLDVSNLNQPNQESTLRGQQIGLMVIPGVEITRAKPFGHMNALFIEDANKFKDLEPAAALDQAIAQNAYVIWNHPGWPDNNTTMYDTQESGIVENKIHGIELFNSNDHYPKVLDWMLRYPVSVFANSDVHHLTGQIYGDRYRPMTLVFAEEYTPASLKEALFAGRTLAFFDQTLAGKEDLLKSLVEQCIEVRVINPDKNTIEIRNESDISFQIRFGGYMYSIPVHPRSVRRIDIPSGTAVSFTNCLTGPDSCLDIELW